jgi:hypothetical protein
MEWGCEAGEGSERKSGGRRRIQGSGEEVRNGSSGVAGGDFDV